MLVLIAECAVYVIASAWPHCLGLGLDPEDLVKELQRNYGAAGQEQFTAAVDLAQTNVSNCSSFSSKSDQFLTVPVLRDRVRNRIRHFLVAPAGPKSKPSSASVLLQTEQRQSNQGLPESTSREFHSLPGSRTGQT